MKGERSTTLTGMTDGDNEIFFPLHLALVLERPYEMIEALVQEGGLQTLTAEDNVGRLPLPVACGQDSPSLNVVHLLVKNYPSATGIRGGSDQLPIEIARENRGPNSVAVVSWLEDFERERVDSIYCTLRGSDGGVSVHLKDILDGVV